LTQDVSNANRLDQRGKAAPETPESLRALMRMRRFMPDGFGEPPAQALFREPHFLSARPFVVFTPVCNLAAVRISMGLIRTTSAVIPLRELSRVGGDRGTNLCDSLV
jgi:hypothetical protein